MFHVLRLLPMFFALCMTSLPAQAATPVCASVQIEIRQEVTLERQAFEARMRITNGLAGIDLSQVRVELQFLDAMDQPVPVTDNPNAQTGGNRFFHRYQLDDALNFSGNPHQGQGGVVKGGSTADLYWLIIPIPSPHHTNPAGTLYKIGAKLTYTIGSSGDVQETVVTPDYIWVKPMPELLLEYFLTENVRANTPFDLGLRIRNTGHGFARNLAVESSQPSIIDNEQQVMISFAMLSSTVNGIESSTSLKTSFGDLAPDAAAMATWTMQCTRGGHFENRFMADLSHADELGGRVTSLIRDVLTRPLFHQVRIVAPGRDHIPDFLVYENHSWTVCGSDGRDEPVLLFDDGDVESVSTDQGMYRLTLSDQTGGHGLIRVRDPFGGARPISQVMGDDGRILPASNAWLVAPVQGVGDTDLYIFDTGTRQVYTVVYGRVVNNNAPTLALSGNSTGYAGELLTLEVAAHDEDDDDLICNVVSAPAGAIVSNHDGRMTLSWTPGLHQVGEYDVVFTAFDGRDTAALPVRILIAPFRDEDDDGLPDVWELAMFGDLSRDGSGDLDGDGVSDAEEYARGTDPRVFDHGPHAPSILYPPDGARLDILKPEFVVEVVRGLDAVVDLQLIHAATLNHVAQQIGVAPVHGRIAWTPDAALVEDGRYILRARVRQMGMSSLWTMVRFQVSANNAPPAFPILSRPLQGELVGSLRPEFEIGPVLDPENDPTFCLFEISADGSEDGVMVCSDALAATSALTWQPAEDLSNQADWWWRVRVRDVHGQELVGPFVQFRIDTQAQVPAVPVLATAQETPFGSATLSVQAEAGSQTRIQAFSVRTGEILLDTVADLDTAGSGSVELVSSAAPGWVAWRARIEKDGAASAWASDSLYVSGPDLPEKPRLANPVQGGVAGISRPWMEVLVANPDAIERYDFEVTGVEGGAVLATASQAGNVWRPINDLPANVSLAWRARGWDWAGRCGPWSSPEVFRINVPAVDVPPRFDWTDSVFGHGSGVFQLEWSGLTLDLASTVSVFAGVRADGSGSVVLGDVPLEAGFLDWNASGITPGLYYIGASVSDGVSTVQSMRPDPIRIEDAPVGPVAMDDHHAWAYAAEGETVIVGNVIDGQPQGGGADQTGTGGPVRVKEAAFAGQTLLPGQVVATAHGQFVLRDDGSYEYRPQAPFDRVVIFDQDVSEYAHIPSSAFSRVTYHRAYRLNSVISEHNSALILSENGIGVSGGDFDYDSDSIDYGIFFTRNGYYNVCQSLIFNSSGCVNVYASISSKEGQGYADTDQFIVDIYDDSMSLLLSLDNQGRFYEVNGNADFVIPVENAAFVGIRAIPSNEEWEAVGKGFNSRRGDSKSSSFYITHLSADVFVLDEERIEYTIVDDQGRTSSAFLILTPPLPQALYSSRDVTLP